jgi:hypothetical protein
MMRSIDLVVVLTIISRPSSNTAYALAVVHGQLHTTRQERLTLMFLNLSLKSVGGTEAEREDDREHSASQESRTGNNARATVGERLYIS